MRRPITEELMFELTNKIIQTLEEKSRLSYCPLPYPPFTIEKRMANHVPCLHHREVQSDLPSFWAANLTLVRWTQSST